MQWVAKAVQYYGSINPATLTGAIDVIVVERPSDSGEPGDVELACSPFHVRITVNDEKIPFYMKVGETGEAFFVFETDKDVPEDLQTSPLAGPVSDDGLADNDDGDAPGEPEFLDLDASADTDQDPDQDRLDDDDPIIHGAEKLAGLSHAALSSSSSSNPKLLSLSTYTPSHSHSDSTSHDNNKEKDHDGGEPSGHDATREMTELESKMRSDLEGLQLSTPEDVGQEVRDAAREKDQDLGRVLGGKEGLGMAQGIEGEERRESFSLQRTRTGEYGGEPDDLFGGPAAASQHPHPEMKGDLMLDMSGYKMDTAPGDDEEGVPAQPATSIDAPLDAQAEAEMVAFTQGLLQSTDPQTLRGFFDPSSDSSEFDSSSRAASPTPEDKDDNRSARASSPVRALSFTSLQSLAEESHEPGPDDGVFNANPRQFSLRVGGRLHVFELSLCGTEDFGHDPTRDEDAFAEHQVTFSQFMEHDDITNHSDLVVKYGGRYLTWDNASPVLASLAVYRKSLVDHPEHHRRLEADPKQQGGRGWSRWWRGSKQTQLPSQLGATDQSSVSLPIGGTSPPVSPPGSRPASPHSLGLPPSPDPFSPATTPIDVDVEHKDRHYAKTLRLTSDQLKTLNLKKGMNQISFSVRSSYSGYATCTSRVFLWESDFQVVISDIDGTITKSDALGHVFTMIGRDWTHLGVAKLYTDIARNGYKMMYLTSRAIGQADTTREYLKGIKQNGFQLPDGPVIMSPDRLMTSLHREVVLRKPEVFKMACLRDIKRLFGERGPFYAGFGNRITDALSYRSVDIPSSRIFTIDTNGEVKMELLELAGYKSSYIHMTDLVDQMFPPINRKTAPDFTDFNFWRAPVMQFDLPDLSPPSPALSARSDGGRLGLTRLGSIASSLSRRSSRGTLAADARRTPGTGTPSSPLLQATLVEEPPALDDEDDEDEDEDDEDEDDGNRSESGSMPGSLPNSSEFERLRNAARKAEGKKKKKGSEAERYKEEVLHAGEDEEEEEAEEAEEEEYGLEDDGDDLDFSSVPYL
ncbi:hypothetical protein RQP46_004160 [Phenoliferia psychrophenolica]